VTARPATQLPRLHAVTDERIARLPDLVIRAQAIGSAGPVAVHARGHALSGREHLELARLLAQAAPERLFVNDRLDVALAAGAAGVQLSPGGLTPRDARRLSVQWWIGVSVHTLEEAASARDAGADYLLVGPVFATPTHPEASPLGIGGFARFVALGVPVVAIGGVTAANLRDLMSAGAHGVAAIRALWDAPDPARAVREMMREME
jgi:thiamine-phosphate pyrophosphorylase